jgi:hypothetical protein
MTKSHNRMNKCLLPVETSARLLFDILAQVAFEFPQNLG